MTRSGFGFDLHPLVPGRPLVLGGVTVPFELGLGGHSDADVLSHAIGEALLGALALGDLGRHFPDTDPRYRGISSLELLREVMKLVNARGGRLINVDATILAQAPTLAGLLPEMAKHLRKTRPDLKILYMSGYAGETMTRGGLLEEHATVLGKPFTAHDLLQKVRELLNEA